MFNKILSPVYFTVGLVIVLRNMTPEQRAEWKLETTTKERRDEIIDEIFAARKAARVA